MYKTVETSTNSIFFFWLNKIWCYGYESAVSFCRLLRSIIFFAPLQIFVVAFSFLSTEYYTESYYLFPHKGHWLVHIMTSKKEKVHITLFKMDQRNVWLEMPQQSSSLAEISGNLFQSASTSNKSRSNFFEVIYPHFGPNLFLSEWKCALFCFVVVFCYWK